MTSLRTLLAASVAIVGIAAASNAHAITSTQTVFVGGGTDSLTTDLNNIAFSNLISQFNSTQVAAANPGYTVSLDDVRLSLNTIISTGGTLKNTSATTQTFSFGLQLDSYVDATGTGTATAAQDIVLANFGSGTSGDISNDFGTKRFNGVASGATVQYPNVSGARATLSTNPTLTLTDLASLGAFTGTGSFGLGLSTFSAQTTGGGGGNVAINLDTRAGGTFTVVYDYTLTAIPPVTDVPEPATLALLGAGLIGAGALRRRNPAA